MTEPKRVIAARSTSISRTAPTLLTEPGPDRTVVFIKGPE